MPLSLLLVAVGTAAYGQAATTLGTFDSNGVKIRYAAAGTGEPVVLIHGWMGDATMWGRDASGNPKLDTRGMEGFQIIALDCRGHGKSDKPHEAAKYGAEMAEDVIRLLDHLGHRKAHLVGYSMGAFIIGKIAATHPDRVLSIVYGGQAPLLKTNAPSTGPSLTEIFAKAVEDGKGLGPYILAVTPPDKPKPTLEQANALANYMLAGKDPKALAAAGLGFKDLRVSEDDLRSCKAPTLFLHGSEESADVKDGVQAARRVLPKSEMILIGGGDHITTLMKPKFGLSIVEFIKANKQN